MNSCSKPFVYSPLIEVDSRVTAAAPLYYGMLLVSRIGTGDMLGTTASASGSNLRAYTVTPADGSTVVVIVNGEASKGVNATVDLGAAVSSATAVYLRGPALTATSGVTLGEAPVNGGRHLEPQGSLHPQSSGNTVTLPVPAASAVLRNRPVTGDGGGGAHVRAARQPGRSGARSGLQRQRLPGRPDR